MRKRDEDNLKAWLMSLPTIKQGITDDLKMETEEFRIWVSRLTKADGATEDNAICVEHYYAREGWK